MAAPIAAAPVPHPVVADALLLAAARAAADARRDALLLAAARAVAAVRQDAPPDAHLPVVADVLQVVLAIVAGHALPVAVARVAVDVHQVVQGHVVVGAHRVVLAHVEAIVLEHAVALPNKVAIRVQRHASKIVHMLVTRAVPVPVVTHVTWLVIVSAAGYVMEPVHHRAKEVVVQLAVLVYNHVM